MRRGELPSMLSLIIIVPAIAILAALTLPHLLSVIHEQRCGVLKSGSSAEVGVIIQQAIASDTRFAQTLATDSELAVFVVPWVYHPRLGLLATDTIIARWLIRHDTIVLDPSPATPSPDLGTRFIVSITPELDRLRVEWRSITRPDKDFCWETAMSQEYRIISLDRVESLRIKNNTAMLDGGTFAEIDDVLPQ